MPEPTNQTTIIGADTRIKGEMHFDGAARILGQFEGTVSAKGDLHVADGAVCKAVIETGRITIDGTIEGNVTARDRAELTARAKVKGDLVASKLLVAEGASFVGHITVGPEAAKGGKIPEASSIAEPKPGAPKPAEAVRR
jgi:cytoskeletal protein CcmA (bactofilin family)